MATWSPQDWGGLGLDWGWTGGGGVTQGEPQHPGPTPLPDPPPNFPTSEKYTREYTLENMLLSHAVYPLRGSADFLNVAP